MGEKKQEEGRWGLLTHGLGLARWRGEARGWKGALGLGEALAHALVNGSDAGR